MSVFDDPMKELEQLQARLEEQEDWFQRELDSAKRMIGQVPEPRQPKAPAAAPEAPVRNYANNYGAQPVRKQVKPVQEPEPEEYEPKKKGMGGLMIVAGLEIAGILAILGYWLPYFLK